MDKKRSKKSTLTQQQRNNKRQRANAQQLEVLRLEYRLCATPDAATRRRISALIDMTERSVQIWFQNTRAKQKKAQRGGKESREETDEFGLGIDVDYDVSMADDVSMSADVSVTSHMTKMSVNVSHVTSHVTSDDPITPITNTHSHHMLATPPTTSSHVTSNDSPTFSPLGHVTPNLTPTTPHHVALPPIFFPTLSLTIGNWRRLSPQISLAYYPSTDIMSYHMTSEKTQFRMQFPFSAIDEIHVSRNPNDTLGALNLTLTAAPSFSIQTPKAPGRWVACHDFSEGKQASHVTTHICNGPATVLQQQLSRVFALRSDYVRMSVGQQMHHVGQMSPVSDHVSQMSPVSSHVSQMSPVSDHVTHVADMITAGISSIDTSNHMISSHVGDFPLSDHVTSNDLLTTTHISDHVTTNLTSTNLGNVTPGHTTPVLGDGFDLGNVAELEQLVNVAHLLPNHVTEEELDSNCHMISSNAFTLDPSTPLSPFSGTLDYLEYY